MDTVILAAGKNGRLKGIVASYMKPLLVVNGQSLIVQAVRHARTSAESKHVIIVAAPQNVNVITDLLEGANELDGVRIVVQTKPRGPAEALYLGAKLAETEKLLVLMGDNVLRRSDVDRVVTSLISHDEHVVVGTRVIHNTDEARRFTLITQDKQTVEGAEDIEPYRWDDDNFHVWLGPLGLRRSAVLNTVRGHLEYRPSEDEIRIGPLLRQMGEVMRVTVDAQDIGVPEALL